MFSDILEFFSRIDTFKDYPDATLFHIFIGCICGWLSERGKQLETIKLTASSFSLQALLIGGWWIAYQFGEFIREWANEGKGDGLEADIAMGLFGVFIGIVACKIYPPLLIHFFAKPKKQEEADDDS